MAEGKRFPHLKLVLKEKFRAKFSGRVGQDPDVKRNKEDRPTHVAKLKGSLQKIKDLFRVELERRKRDGLPAVDAGVGFVMRIPAGADPDEFAHALGVELVAESDGGFMLVATQDLSFERLESVLEKFSEGVEGGGAAASLLDVFESPDAQHRLERLLAPEVLKDWPFKEDQQYIFDISIQTAEGTRSFSIPRIRKQRKESQEDFQNRKQKALQDARAGADVEWTDQAEERYKTLADLVAFYGGEMMSGVIADGPTDFASIIRFPDSFEVRVRVSGKGWSDIIKNMPNIFEVRIPEDVEQPLPPNGIGEGEQGPQLSTPDEGAPAVCIVDSGIQEGHLWLEPAIDTETSRCFIPNRAPEDVHDEVKPSGHGTRVAGAVLYPREVPKTGPVVPVAWLQNARVLDADNQLPKNLPPAKYVEEVVAHFKGSAKQTRLYNHSVASRVACESRRMSTWATKIDELAHKEDVLFVQAVGNIRHSTGQQNNPGVWEHLQSGRPYPTYFEAPAAGLANPAQSLQALTVGSVALECWRGDGKHSFVSEAYGPSAFSRSGYGMWESVKPEVVEIGGDYAIADGGLTPPTIEPATAVELVRTAGDGGPAVARDDVGTSYAAPKVAHLAAVLQRMLPDAPTLLYRGLIVHSARWPGWANGNGWNADGILKLIGFGLPSLERATENTDNRVTLITPKATVIRNQELHLYRIVIPDELRNRAEDVSLRLAVTLSYSSEPRRTRTSRRGYLATWLDWRSSGLGEPFEAFKKRMVVGEKKPARRYPQPEWCLHDAPQRGDANETQRGNGTLQKDWAVVKAHELGQELFIAVRAHKGWDHREGGGGARYCLIVSIEAEDVRVPVYATVTAVNVEAEVKVEQEAVVPVRTA